MAKATLKEEADLVVIGRTHKTGLEQFYSGSTVIEIIRRVSIPVLVYKPVTDSPFATGQPFERPYWQPTGPRPACRRSITSLI